MSEAMYGLIGALGGALLGAAATVSAPVLTGRQTRLQAQRVRNEAEFDRMMELRRTTRDLLLILDDGRQAMHRGEPVRLGDRLDEAIRRTRESADRCEMYGLRFEHSRSSAESAGAREPSPETEALRELVRFARATASWIDAAGRADSARRPAFEQRADGHYESAENARRQLLGVLMDRMEELREELGRS
ncbi:hypothetical protein [Streptomyces sp. NPDC057340]|uniref:hypothetical protein n=1 Tax=Streptomyces sp. NPDC057340 TaxID=3346103 RepID=UPI003631B481